MKQNLKSKALVATVFGLAVLMSGCNRQYQEDRKAQHISCVNNMKQIGLAFKIWEGDNGDQYPFNTSTNHGGTMEMCLRGPDGFDSNSFLHFQVMSNEVSSCKILVCPEDRSKTVALNWGTLSASNVTYRLRTGLGISETNSHAVLLVCPIDGNVLYCDGTVLDKDGKVPK